jgi:hypothetical protein
MRLDDAHLQQFQLRTSATPDGTRILYLNRKEINLSETPKLPKGASVEERKKRFHDHVARFTLQQRRGRFDLS